MVSSTLRPPLLPSDFPGGFGSRFPFGAELIAFIYISTKKETMPRRTRRVPTELQCELPHCECKALPPLYCGHKFCSACMLALVHMTHPHFAMLVMTRPICRDKCSIGEVTFAMLMKQHRPKGTLLMDFVCTKAGFCLAMQRQARRGFCKKADFFFLEAPYYLHHLNNLPPDEWDMNSLFNELSRKSQTRMEAIHLLADMPFPSPPFQLVTDELLELQLPARGLSDEQGVVEENVGTI